MNQNRAKLKKGAGKPYFIRLPSARGRGTVPTKEWKRRFSNYQKRGIKFALFTGGEPSLRYDVLKLSERYFPFIAVFTNGQKKIPKSFKHRIFLSLDGLKEEHKKIRGNDIFDKEIGGLL